MFKISARTILELGSELISSDIIAFYELVKNCIDAKSKTGADIRFNILLKKNNYVDVRKKISSDRNLSDLKKIILEKMEVSAALDSKIKFESLINSSKGIESLLKNLDIGYELFNSIEIIDSGTGMSIDQLRENYLTIGTPSRKKSVDMAIILGETESPYLGEKGIGRLSAMRLGECLRVETSTIDEKYINVLEIDWRLFSDINAMVEDINIVPTRIKKDSSWSGTKLKISNLSAVWSENAVKDLCEYEFSKITDHFLDQKRRPRIAIIWNDSRIAIPTMNSLLLDNAHAKFSGMYRVEDGFPKLTVTMEAINLGFDHPRQKEVSTLSLPDLESLILGQEQAIPISALTDVGDFEFEAYWYNRRRLSGIESIGNQKAVRELLEKWSGILLFRDRFRVFPYGEDKDDWLGLDRKALGRPGYVLNKTQFVGHVNITRLGNPELVDQTNREGLRATPEQVVFISLLQHVIRDMLFLFFKNVEREHKNQAIDLSDSKIEIEKLEVRAKSALLKVRKLVPSNELYLVDDLQHAFNEFQEFSKLAKIKIAEVEADSLQMIHMAGVGLMVEVVAHELARATESALAAIEVLRGKDMPQELKSKLETLKSEMKSVSKRLRILDQLSVSGRQRAEIFDINELIDEIAEGHESQFKRHGIILNFEKSDKPIRIKLVKGMLIQIIENLISNSIYWTSLRKKSEPWYVQKININVLPHPLTLIFSDNGRGVSPENQEKIFRPFWSLKDKGKRRGLGLYIAKENAQYLDGKLYLASDVNGETGRLHDFILELPDMVLVK